MFYELKRKYYSIKDWFRNCFNKHHFKTVWAAFKNRPWDYAETYDVLKHRLIEQREYFKKSDIIVQESIDKIVSQLDLALSLYDIMSGEVSAGHWEYEWNERVNENGSSSNSLNRMQYVAERYVNTRNRHRFSNHKEVREYYQKCPQELYEEKARRLFWRMMAEHSMNWWD